MCNDNHVKAHCDAHNEWLDSRPYRAELLQILKDNGIEADDDANAVADAIIDLIEADKQPSLYVLTVTDSEDDHADTSLYNALDECIAAAYAMYEAKWAVLEEEEKLEPNEDGEMADANGSSFLSLESFADEIKSDWNVVIQLYSSHVCYQITLQTAPEK